MRRKIAAGNWKMNGTSASLAELETLDALLPANASTVVICPPATLLFAASTQARHISIGAQNCHQNPSGAFTGDISADMVADSGATYVILGHSERREVYGETNADIHAKSTAAWAANLTPIICIGETLTQREDGQTLDVIGEQLAGSVPDGITSDNTVIAYEPIWAIGTGKIPAQTQITQVHDFIRSRLTDRFGAKVANAIPLLYGGSVKPDNAAAIFKAENVDGALVGGASLKSADFLPIISALSDS